MILIGMVVQRLADGADRWRTCRGVARATRTLVALSLSRGLAVRVSTGDATCRVGAFAIGLAVVLLGRERSGGAPIAPARS